MKDPAGGKAEDRRRNGAGPWPVDSWPSETRGDNSAHRSTRWWPLLLVAVVAVVVVAVVLHPRTPLATPAPLPPLSASTPSRTTPIPAEPPLLTDPASVTSGITELGHPILAITAGWELFARGNDNSVMRIELAKGRMTRTAVPGLASSGPISFLAGPDRALIRPLDWVPGFVVRDGHTAGNVAGALSHGGPVVIGPDTAHVWADTAANGSPDVMTLTDWNGNPTTTSFPVPKDWVGITATSDGAGGLLFTGQDGSTYQTYPGRSNLLTTGSLLAVGPTGYLVSECAAGKCLTSVIDRTTRQRRVLVTSIAIRGGGPGVIAPDGKFAAVFDAPKGEAAAGRLLLVDLVSGAQHQLGPGLNAGSILWSPDSRWLIVATVGGRVAVMDPGTGEVGDLGLQLPFVKQLAIRAAPASVR